VAAHRERYCVTIALPTILGREGATGDLDPIMSDDERRRFEHSARMLRDATDGIGVR
jgi:malate/lactate dehydrogenase